MSNESTLELLARARREELMRRARDGKILAFTQYTYPQYEVNWHHKLTAQYLNKFIKRDIKRLMIFMPPRYGKSELGSRRLPALIHGLYPNDSVMCATYNSELSEDMTVDVQRIMDTPDYHELFPYSKITPEGTMSKYARTRNEHELIPVKGKEGYIIHPKGGYKAQGVGGSFTGRGANWLIMDDLFKNRSDADSKSFRDSVYKFYTSTLRTRLEKDGCILLMMTLWHEDDLAGKILKLAQQNKDADQWTMLKLPAVREDTENTEDPRMIGEPLWPTKFSAQDLVATRASSGHRDWAALYQQNPNVEGGNIFKKDWCKLYKILPSKFDQQILSCDFAVKGKDEGSFNVIQVWGRIGIDKYFIGQARFRGGFPVAVQRLIDVCRTYPNAHKKYVEAKANGPAIIETLKRSVPGLIESEPSGDKVARANAVAPDVQSGNVWFPDPSIAPWIEEYFAELCGFPNAPNDDQVDATTQALSEFRKIGPLYLPIAGHGSGVIY